MKTLLIIMFVPLFFALESSSEKHQNGAPQRPWKSNDNYLFSDWQLTILSDLLFEITTNRCPDMNQTLIVALKAYVHKQVSRAPRRTSNSEIFYPIYGDLLECVANFNPTAKPTPTPKTAIRSADADTDSRTKLSPGFKVGPAKVATERSYDHSSPENSLSIFNFAWRLLFPSTQGLFQNSIGRTRTKTKAVASPHHRFGLYQNDADLNLNRNSPSTSSTEATAVDLDPLTNAKGQFSDLIQTLTTMACYACAFSRTMKWRLQVVTEEVTNQMLEWIFKDDAGIVKEAEYFFQNASLLKQITECKNVIAIDRIVALSPLW